MDGTCCNRNNASIVGRSSQINENDNTIGGRNGGEYKPRGVVAVFARALTTFSQYQLSAGIMCLTLWCGSERWRTPNWHACTCGKLFSSVSACTTVLLINPYQ